MPQKMNRRNAVYLDPSLHKALMAKSEVSGISISELVNEAVCEELVEDFKDIEKEKLSQLLKGSVQAKEDEQDLEAFHKRAHEPTVTFKQLLKKLNLKPLTP